MPDLTPAQRNVLQKLSDGWELHPAGRDKLGGFFIHWEKRKLIKRRVPRTVMNRLYLDGLIEQGEDCYVISPAGRAALVASPSPRGTAGREGD